MSGGRGGVAGECGSRGGVAGELVAVCTVHEVRPDPGMKGRTAIDKRPRAGMVQIGTDGLEGDVIADEVNHGGRDQAVYAYAREEAARWVDELGREVPPGWFGENLAVRGLVVTDAVIGERWRIGGNRADATVLEVTLPRTPCMTFTRWVQQPHWVRRFAERGDVGAYLRVVQPGTVVAGDPVQVLSRPAHGVTVRELFGDTDPERMARLLEHGTDVPAKAVAKAQRMLAHG